MLLEQGQRPVMFNALTWMSWQLLAQQEKPAADNPPGLFDMLSGMALPIGMIIVLYIFLMVLPQLVRTLRSRACFEASVSIS